MSSFKENSEKVLEETKKLNKKLSERAENNHDCWLMYEDLQERHEAEMKETKKHWKQICAILVITIAILVGGILYVAYNCDFCRYNQNTSGGGDSNFVGNDGDISYGFSKDTAD